MPLPLLFRPIVLHVSDWNHNSCLNNLYIWFLNKFNWVHFSYSLSGNKGLCGLPSLPECPLFWGTGGLSTGGKIAVGLASLFFLCVLLLVIYIFCIRRRNNDYDFGLPHDLMCKYGFNREHKYAIFMILLLAVNLIGNIVKWWPLRHGRK